MISLSVLSGLSIFIFGLLLVLLIGDNRSEFIFRHYQQCFIACNWACLVTGIVASMISCFCNVSKLCIAQYIMLFLIAIDVILLVLEYVFKIPTIIGFKYDENCEMIHLSKSEYKLDYIFDALRSVMLTGHIHIKSKMYAMLNGDTHNIILFRGLCPPYGNIRLMVVKKPIGNVCVENSNSKVYICTRSQYCDKKSLLDVICDIISMIILCVLSITFGCLDYFVNNGFIIFPFTDGDPFARVLSLSVFIILFGWYCRYIEIQNAFDKVLKFIIFAMYIISLIFLPVAMYDMFVHIHELNCFWDFPKLLYYRAGF